MLYISKILLGVARIIFVTTLLLFVSITGRGQSENDLPAELGLALGVYQLNMEKSNARGFEDFKEFVIKEYPDQDIENPIMHPDRTVDVSGYLIAANVKFEFLECKLERTKGGAIRGVQFVTVVHNGTMYRFNGEFLTETVEEGGQFTRIRGTLEKRYRGEVLHRQLLPFFEYAEL